MKAWHHCFTSLELLLTEGFDVVEIILNWKDSLPGKHWSGLKSVSKSSWGKIGLMGAVSLCGQNCDALKCHHSWALAAAVEGSDRKWDLTMERKEKRPKERLKQRFEQHHTARWLGYPLSDAPVLYTRFRNHMGHWEHGLKLTFPGETWEKWISVSWYWCWVE